MGQALGTFLVCESAEGLVLIDQHAAAERITFERLRTQYREGRVVSQLLLVPVRCDLDERQVDIVEHNEGLLRAFGLAADVTGPQCVTVREVPMLLSDTDPVRLLEDVVGQLEDERGRIEALVEDVLATMACHGSARGGDSLGDSGARALLADLDIVDWGTHCPHGRPVSFEISLSELHRRLGRRG
jgi:DNA mismatch repair protein MutL